MNCLLLLIALAFRASPAFSNDDRPLVPERLREFRQEDVMKLKAVKSTKLSPDGQWLAYVLGPCDTFCRQPGGTGEAGAGGGSLPTGHWERRGPYGAGGG